MAIKVAHHRMMRKLVIGFGELFNNMALVRYNTDGTENQRVKVPIVYAPKEKYITRLLDDPELSKKIQINLPRMSYDILSMDYDSSRKQATTAKTVAPSGTTNTGLYTNSPVPYNFKFELYLYVRNIEDGTQIIETILPYFQPDYTIKLNMVPEMGITREVPITLNNIDYHIDAEGDRDSKTRIIIWTLSFTVKAFLYGPVIEQNLITNSQPNSANGGVYINFVANDVYEGSEAEFYVDTNNGFGTYESGEIVYQGYSLESATARGKLKFYDNSSGTLHVTNINGYFRNGENVIGQDSLAQYIMEDYSLPERTMGIMRIGALPNTAMANSNFAYNVTTQYV